MLRFILTKIGILLPTFFGVTVVAFIFIRMLPGDPVMLMAGERGMSDERHAELMQQFGFDRPIIVQYGSYMADLVRGDLGTSIITKKPVLEEFLTLFPATIELSLFAIIIAVLVGLPAGIIAAVKRGSFFDHTVMTGALTGYSMPIFWWGLLLIILFSGILGWTPVSGRINLLYYFEPVTGFMLIDSLLSGQEGAFRSAISHLILPSVVLSTIPLAALPGPRDWDLAGLSACMPCAMPLFRWSPSLVCRWGYSLPGPFSRKLFFPGRASANGWSIPSSAVTTPRCRVACL